MCLMNLPPAAGVGKMPMLSSTAVEACTTSSTWALVASRPAVCALCWRLSGCSPWIHVHLYTMIRNPRTDGISILWLHIPARLSLALSALEPSCSLRGPAACISKESMQGAPIFPRLRLKGALQLTSPDLIVLDGRRSGVIAPRIHEAQHLVAKDFEADDLLLIKVNRLGFGDWGRNVRVS